MKMKVIINLFFITMAVLVAALVFIDIGMVNIGNMPLAGLANFVTNRAIPPLVLPAAISAGAGLVNGLFNLFSNKSANKQNVAMQRETNALNYQMFQEGNAFNRQMAFDMFNAENEYNTPKNQVERLMDAHLNPALAADNATATTGNGDASTPSSAAASPMIAPQVQPVGSPFSSVFDNVEKLASAFQKVNQGNLSSAQKEFVLEQAKSERLDQINKDLQNTILQAYGMQQADANVKKTLDESRKINSEIDLLVKQGKVADAEKRLKTLQAIAQKNENKVFTSTFEYVVQAAQEKVNLLKAETKEANTRSSANVASAKASEASAASSYADADYKKALKLTEDNLRDLRVSAQKIANGITAQDFLKRDKGFTQEVDNYLDLLNKGKAFNEEELKKLHESAELAKKHNTYFYWKAFFDQVHEFNEDKVKREHSTNETLKIFVPFAE